MDTNYAEKEYWENKWKRTRYTVANREDPIVQLIEQYVPNAKEGEECYEIGCVPCGYLAYVGLNKHYIVNGIDYSDELDRRLINWLKQRNVTVGEIKKGDFFTNKPPKKYKFVYSLGFVEHFDDFEHVICMHDRYVEKNGYLLITAPNYKGTLNYFWNKVFNPIVMGKHNLNSMQPKLWASILRLKGYHIIWKGYFGGGFSPWNDDPENSRGLIKNLILRGIASLIKQNLKMKSRKCYSPYCGVVAKKI